MPEAEVPPVTGLRVVTGDYFTTMGIRVRGRAPTDADAAAGRAVAVLSEATAEAYFPGVDAVGRRISFGGTGEEDWFTVVGVAENVKTRLTSDELQRIIRRGGRGGAVAAGAEGGEGGSAGGAAGRVVAASEPRSRIYVRVPVPAAGSLPARPAGANSTRTTRCTPRESRAMPSARSSSTKPASSRTRAGQRTRATSVPSGA